MQKIYAVLAFVWFPTLVIIHQGAEVKKICLLTIECQLQVTDICSCLDT